MGNAVTIKERNIEIAQDHLNAMSYREIAKKHDISKTTVFRALKKTEIKEIIETGTEQIISMVPLAAQNILSDLLIKDTDDTPLRVLRNKTSDRVLQTASITPGNVTNQTINNIYAIQNNVTLSPGVAKSMGIALDNNDEDVLEGEIIETN